MKNRWVIMLILLIASSSIISLANGQTYPSGVPGTDMIWRQRDLTVTYRFENKASCQKYFVIYGLVANQNPQSLQAVSLANAVQGSMNAWAQWVIGLKWVEVTSNEEVLIHPCGSFGQLQTWADQQHTSSDGSQIADHTWVDIYANPVGGVEWVHHEFGHVLGLNDNPQECVGSVQTELMCSFGGGANPAVLAGRDGTYHRPSQRQIDELNGVYGGSSITTTTTATPITTSSTTSASTSSTYGVSVEVSPSVWPQSILTFGQSPTPTTIVLSAVGWFGIIAALIFIMLIPTLKRRRM